MVCSQPGDISLTQFAPLQPTGGDAGHATEFRTKDAPLRTDTRLKFCAQRQPRSRCELEQMPHELLLSQSSISGTGARFIRTFNVDKQIA